MLQNEDSEGHCPAGSKGAEQGEHEGLEDQNHAGKMGEGSCKLKRGKADAVVGMDRTQICWSEKSRSRFQTRIKELTGRRCAVHLFALSFQVTTAQAALSARVQSGWNR